MRIRKSRSNALKVVKKGIAGSLEGVSKDDAFRVQQELEVMVNETMDKLNQLCEEKEKSVTSV